MMMMVVIHLPEGDDDDNCVTPENQNDDDCYTPANIRIPTCKAK